MIWAIGMSSAAGTNSTGYLTSELLTRAGFRHAFFTREGGVSEGPFASLNFSASVGDDPARVRENVRRAAVVVGVDPAKIYYLSQIHGTVAQHASPASESDEFVKREGDIVVGDSPEIACGVRSADCVPILLAHAESGRVAAVHAGWRGVVSGAVATGVRALDPDSLGRGALLAAIGPHISRQAFEVSDDVAEALVNASLDPNVVERSLSRPHVDLRRIVRAQLEQLGLAPRFIDDVNGCTFLDRNRFFSFRRDGARSGRHLSLIVPRGGAASSARWLSAQTA